MIANYSELYFSKGEDIELICPGTTISVEDLGWRFAMKYFRFIGCTVYKMSYDQFGGATVRVKESEFYDQEQWKSRYDSALAYTELTAPYLYKRNFRKIIDK